MTNLFKVEAVVEEILETCEAARTDDYILFRLVTEKVKPSLLLKPFETVMTEHYQNGLPNWESVTRARRKIQSRRPELCDDRTVRKRADRQKDFEEYART